MSDIKAGDLIEVDVLQRGIFVPTFGRVVAIVPGSVCPYRVEYDLGDGRGLCQSDFPVSKARALRSRQAVATAIDAGGEALELAPDGCWLERAKCYQRDCYQVYYRAREPIFSGKKRLYVGMEGSAAVAQARAAVARRNALRGRV